MQDSFIKIRHWTSVGVQSGLENTAVALSPKCPCRPARSSIADIIGDVEKAVNCVDTSGKPMFLVLIVVSRRNRDRAE